MHLEITLMVLLFINIKRTPAFKGNYLRKFNLPLNLNPCCMKLISAQIKNYSNVVNTKEFEVENVTCLAGKNIEGKTNTLRALSRLNPADPLDGNFFDLRRSGDRLGDLNDRPENILETRWILMQEDIKMIEKYLGRRCLTSEVVTIRKGYKNELQWDIPINFDFYRQDSPVEVSGNQ